MGKPHLEWEITSQEAKTRTLQSIPIVANVLAGLVLIWAIKEKSWMVVLIFIGILIALYVFTLVFAKFKSRKFQINEAGIIVSKGTKEKTYSWNNFEYFFTHSVIVNRNIREVKDTRARITANDMIAASDQLTEINGKTFYLKKNKQNFWDKFVKTFVVIYTKPDNSAEVEQTLSEYLPHKPMDNATEAGLVKYEFK